MLKLLAKEEYANTASVSEKRKKKKKSHYHTILLKSWCAVPWIAKCSSLGQRTTNKYL